MSVSSLMLCFNATKFLGQMRYLHRNQEILQAIQHLHSMRLQVLGIFAAEHLSFSVTQWPSLLELQILEVIMP
jgi:hypothetical protein